MAVLKAKVIRQAKKKSATRGRRSCYPRPRVDDIVKDFWNPQCCFPIIKVLFGIKQYIYVGCSKSKKIKVCKETPAPLKGRVNFFCARHRPRGFCPSSHAARLCRSYHHTQAHEKACRQAHYMQESQCYGLKLKERIARQKSKGGAVFSVTRGLCDIARVITFSGFFFQRS